MRTRSGSATGLALLRACHPEPTAAVTGLALLLGLAVGAGMGRALLIAATVAASQLAVGWSNDALDAGRDAAVGRTDKPIVAGAIGRRTVALGAVAAGVATALLALATGPVPAAVALLGLLSALAYNWPLKSTVLSVLPYAVSFAALPAFVLLAGSQTPPVWLLAAGALLGAGAHFANALPDLADDAATGVRGLPHRLGSTGSAGLAAGLLLATTAILVVAPPGLPTPVRVGALAVAVVALPAGWYAHRAAIAAGRRGSALFRGFIVVALVDVGLLLAGGAVLS